MHRPQSEMAEAHAAVAFSFTVSHEGVNFDVNHEALKAVWRSGIRSWKKRLGRMKVRRCVWINVAFGRMRVDKAGRGKCET